LCFHLLKFAGTFQDPCLARNPDLGEVDVGINVVIDVVRRQQIQANEIMLSNFDPIGSRPVNVLGGIAFNG
jgi:hypothetical protein